MIGLTNTLSQINRALCHGDATLYLKKTQKTKSLLQALMEGGLVRGFMDVDTTHFLVSTKTHLRAKSQSTKKLILFSKPVQIKRASLYQLKSFL